MRDRPEGDAIDQLLRRGITALVDSAPPDTGDHTIDAVPERELPSESWRRIPVLLAAACTIAIIALGGLWAIDDQPTTVDVVTPPEAASQWQNYLSQSTADEQLTCITQWSLNRDLRFRIPGDQFAVSTTVTGFVIDSRTTLAWLNRHETGFQLLRESAPNNTRPAIDAVLAALADTRSEAMATDQVDIASAITAIAARRDPIFTTDPACPLGPAEDQRDVHRALVALSNNDTTPMLTGVRCADAELDRISRTANNDSPTLAAYILAGPLNDVGDLNEWRQTHPYCPWN